MSREYCESERVLFDMNGIDCMILDGELVVTTDEGYEAYTSIEYCPMCSAALDEDGAGQ